MQPNIWASCGEISLNLIYFFNVWVALTGAIKIHNRNRFVMSNDEVLHKHLGPNPIIFPSVLYDLKYFPGPSLT